MIVGSARTRAKRARLGDRRAFLYPVGNKGNRYADAAARNTRGKATRRNDHLK